MQIPTVTLEDLQAFQAQHFPGTENLHSSTAEPTHHEQNDDEEDLGYYPDGVKRTLTDEQIEIFRHSEIHALLRARQLERDEAEYEARREPETEPKDQNSTMGKQEKVEEEQPAPAKTLKRSAKHMDQDMSETLDYEDNVQHPPPHPAQKRNDVFSGRKIISYED